MANASGESSSLKRVDFLGRRRQAGEVERRAADQRQRVGGGTGARPSRSSRARMKRSMSFFGHAAWLTAGIAGLRIG